MLPDKCRGTSSDEIPPYITIYIRSYTARWNSQSPPNLAEILTTSLLLPCHRKDSTGRMQSSFNARRKARVVGQDDEDISEPLETPSAHFAEKQSGMIAHPFYTMQASNNNWSI